MVIHPSAYRKLSLQQLKELSPKKDEPYFRNVIDQFERYHEARQGQSEADDLYYAVYEYPGDSEESAAAYVCRKKLERAPKIGDLEDYLLRSRGTNSAQATVSAIPSAIGALGLATGGSYWDVAMFAALGLAGLVGVAINCVHSRQNQKAYEFIHEQGLDVEQRVDQQHASLIVPGSQAGTLEDHNFFNGDRLTELYEVRSQDTGKVIGRHARLNTPSPVLLQEDTSTGLVTLQSASGNQVFPATMELPRNAWENVSLTHTVGTTSMSQTFPPFGESIVVTEDESTRLKRVYPVNSSPPWQDGLIYADSLVVHPFVHAREMALESTGLKPHRVTVYPNKQWSTAPIHQLDLPMDLARGQVQPVKLGPVVGQVRRYSSFLLSQQSGQPLQIQRGDKCSELPGQLTDKDTILFTVQGRQATQNVLDGVCEVAVSLPEGRVVLHHEKDKPALAHRFSGGICVGAAPVRQTPTGYSIALDGEEMAVSPPLAREVLFA